MLVTGDSFGKMLCGALGLDPKETRKITIHCEAEAVVTVEIERYLDSNQISAVLQCASKIDPSSIIYVDVPKIGLTMAGGVIEND